ncbi:MAG: carbohydrate-binding family 9-like protein [Lentisphaerae bacterium]|nr:carbohydrate-binding family 9-like protein [Lentisphaerota bacterium]
MRMVVPRIDDFEVSGDGSAASWAQIEWASLALVSEARSGYATRCKIAYSQTGIYFLVDCEDRVLTCTMTEDYDNIFQEDVVEVFLWPNEEQTLYFEYEISPLEVELPILVPNNAGTFMGWLPWQYGGERRVRKATSVRGGAKESMASVEGWTAEFFFPFTLLRGLGNMPPEVGTTWRANVYRIDYDGEEPVQWALCEDSGTNFHNFRGFGTLEFGA